MDNEPDISIDDLKVRDYSEKARTHTKLEGQTAGLRRFDPKDKIDMMRLRESLDDNAAMEWFIGGPHSPPEEQDEPMTDEEVIGWSEENAKGSKGSLLYAVVGSDKVDSDEKGEVQGWIAVWRDQTKRVRELRNRGSIPAFEKGRPVLELSYAKLSKSPGGQMASAVRQTCVELARMDAARYPLKESEERSLFEKQLEIKKQSGLDTAQELLLRSEFETNLVEKYNKPRSIVTAYVSPANPDSMKVLEASGFVNKGLIDVDEFSEEYRQNHAFVLDWDILNKKLHEASDKALMQDVKVEQPE